MGNTYYKAYYHIVFCIKHKRDFFHQSIRDEVFGIIAGIIKSEDAVPIIVGGHVDHVHLLVSINPKYSISVIVSKIKTRSNRVLKIRKLVSLDFEWQNGFGLFTVSTNNFEIVKRYIKNQDEHHRNKGFGDEFISILKELEIEYDDKYLFDFLT